MINSEKDIKHKGLRDLLLYNSKKGLLAKDIPKIRRVLFALTSSNKLDDLAKFSEFKLHPLKGDLKGFWSITVSGNYRIIFKFDNGYYYEIDYIDYH